MICLSFLTQFEPVLYFHTPWKRAYHNKAKESITSQERNKYFWRVL